MKVHKVYRSKDGNYFACDLSVGRATEAWEDVTCPDCLAHKAPPVSSPLGYALSSLRRAADAGQSWSVSPTEAAALVAEVERLRKQNHALRTAEQDARDAEQGAAACDQIESLLDGVSLENPCPEAARVAALLSERDRLRAEVSYLRACVPPTRPTDYGHEVWTETVRAFAAAERAAVVAFLRVGARLDPRSSLCGYADAIEHGEHRASDCPYCGAPSEPGGCADCAAEGYERGEHP